ncbi:MAG: MBL fold metallo-hydrolase [Candidatus Nanohaloarchaea archaeon]
MKVEVLGSAQDGGTPHLGCDCEFCERTREDPTIHGLISSIMIEKSEGSGRYLVEATPNIMMQIGSKYVDGLFVPHARLGTLGGIEFFGEEGMDADNLAVYCNPDVKHHLMNNDPYRRLIDRGNISTMDFCDGDSEQIGDGSIKALTMDHPHLGHDTTAYRIRGSERTLFYLPDINDWTPAIKREIEDADLAIIDGTFWSRDEIDRYDEVPHPTVQDSMEEFSDLETEIYFTHLNHTNPLLLKDSEEREEVESRGFGVAERGMEFEL